MNFFEMRVGDVCIDLGGRDVAVAQHGLDRAEVCAIHEQVCRKRVAKRMGADVLGNARHQRVMRHQALHTARSQAVEVATSVNSFASAVANEKGSDIVSAPVEIFLEPVCRLFANENGSILLAFTADHKLSPFEVNVFTVKPNQLRNTKPRTKK